MNPRQKISWLWENAERVIIILFLATFSFNIRKVFLTPHSFLNGEFNEYTTLSISWADCLMIAAILIYITKTLYRQIELPLADNSLLRIVIRFKSTVLRYLNSVSRETILFMLFLIWISLSVTWAAYKPVALYRDLALLITVAFFAVFISKLNDKRWFKIAILSFIIGGLAQAVIGILQFSNNGSVGIHLLGESIISPNLPGVAKFIFHGQKHIRSYGTFPHPNILAGFLIIPIFIAVGISLEKLTHKLQRHIIASRETFAGASLVLFVAAFTILAAGFVLTFSRSAFLGLLGGAFVLFAKISSPAGKRKYSCMLLGLILLFFAAFIVSRSGASFLLSDQSLNERALYSDVSREIISDKPLAGTGLGQFIYNFYLRHPNLPGWQYQPVHNIFLLMTSELGIVGLLLVLLSLASFFGKMVSEMNQMSILTISLYCCIISFPIVSVFDHYFWDTGQGLLIFAISVSLAKVSKKQIARR